jgi:hypothetical protein
MKIELPNIVKPLIKVVKRGTEVTTKTNCEPESAAAELKAARLTKREIVKTVTSWIDERLEQNRLAEIVARESFSKSY